MNIIIIKKRKNAEEKEKGKTIMIMRIVKIIRHIINFQMII